MDSGRALHPIAVALLRVYCLGGIAIGHSERPSEGRLHGWVRLPPLLSMGSCWGRPRKLLLLLMLICTSYGRCRGPLKHGNSLLLRQLHGVGKQEMSVGCLLDGSIIGGGSVGLGYGVRITDY